MAANVLCGSWYHHTCIGLTERYVICVPRYHCQACIDSGPKYTSFANFVLHYDLSFNDYNRAHKARNRVCPGCVSIKGLQNPKSNCWMNSVLQVVCSSSFFDLLSHSVTESNDNLFQQLDNVTALLCQNDGTLQSISKDW